MITAILAFIAQIPGLAGLAQAWVKARYDRDVAITAARIGGDVAKAQALVAAQVEAEHARVDTLAILSGNRLLTVLVILFALPIVGLMWKVIFWDVIGGSFAGCAGKGVAGCEIFSTDPVRGQIAEIVNVVVWAIFGSTTALGGIAAVIRGMRK